MKTLVLSAMIAAAAACAVPTYAAEPDASSFVKDSVITTKVKAKLAEKHMSTLANVKVDTDNAGAVWLSGKAPTKDARDLAGMLAKDTDGVTSVHNNIVIAQ